MEKKRRKRQNWRWWWWAVVCAFYYYCAVCTAYVKKSRLPTNFVRSIQRIIVRLFLQFKGLYLVHLYSIFRWMRRKQSAFLPYFEWQKCLSIRDDGHLFPCPSGRCDVERSEIKCNGKRDGKPSLPLAESQRHVKLNEIENRTTSRWKSESDQTFGRREKKSIKIGHRTTNDRKWSIWTKIHQSFTDGRKIKSMKRNISIDCLELVSI